MVACKCCGKHYIGSGNGFKERFRIHKSDTNTGKREGEDVDQVLWEKEKYWYAQLFTLTNGLNNMNE